MSDSIQVWPAGKDSTTDQSRAAARTCTLLAARVGASKQELADVLQALGLMPYRRNKP